MIELKISGENMQSLFNDAAQVLAFLVAGAQAQQSAVDDTETYEQASAKLIARFQAKHAADAPKTDTLLTASEAEALANPAPGEAPIVVKPKGRPKKAEVIEPEQLDIENATPVEITDDEMRQRVKDIVARHTERGNEMPHCINYVKELFLPFAVKNAVQIPAGRRAEFMKASLPYLEGTA